MQRVAIVDYGMGNLRSVANAVRIAGAEPIIVAERHALQGHERIILPGVGAFARAMQNLEQGRLRDPLERERIRGTPILGICLGMQLMCLSSEEEGEHLGLGWVDAKVKRFPSSQGIKVPHMGWDDVSVKTDHPLTRGMRDGSDFYFVHSYYVDMADSRNILLACEYGMPFCALFASGNVCGAQFHPEKSQQAGLRLIKNFLDWMPC
jgi:glutamine amidotransferase